MLWAWSTIKPPHCHQPLIALAWKYYVSFQKGKHGDDIINLVFVQNQNKGLWFGYMQSSDPNNTNWWRRFFSFSNTHERRMVNFLLSIKDSRFCKLLNVPNNCVNKNEVIDSFSWLTELTIHTRELNLGCVESFTWTILNSCMSQKKTMNRKMWRQKA